MALLTLLSLGILILLLNKNHYLREYQTTRLPHLGTLVLLLVIPLVIVDHRVTRAWLHLSWLLLLAVGSLASFIDWEHHLLPDRLLLPTFFISTFLIAVDGVLRPALIGALSWFSGFALLALINPTGLGWGDVKFAALLGADAGAINLKLVPVALFLALTSGGVYALYLIAKGRRGAQIAFGPFMFIGAIASLFTG